MRSETNPEDFLACDWGIKDGAPIRLRRINGTLTVMGCNSATQEAIRRFHAAKYPLAYPTRSRRLWCAAMGMFRRWLHGE